MSMRALFLAGLAVWLVGCPSGEMSDPSQERDSVPVSGTLELEGEPTRSMLPGGSETLRVRYLNDEAEPVADVEVEFGLTGAAEGASLSAARVPTDENGYAETTLLAGRTAPEFQVRASVIGAKPEYFGVTVLMASSPALTVSVSYGGMRQIKSYSVALVEGMTCPQVLGNAAEVRSSTSIGPQDTAKFTPGAGRNYAIAVWGSDDTNSKLVAGCKTYTAMTLTLGAIAADEQESVTVSDLNFTVAPNYPMTFSLDLRALLATLSPIAREVVSAALPENATPEASFLLDALARKGDFAAARSSEGLDSLLQAALVAYGVGPTHFAAALADMVADGGATCQLSAMLTAQGPAAGAPEQELDDSVTLTQSVYAAPTGAVGQQVMLSAVPVVKDFRATYDPATATVAIPSFKVSLGFGSYAVYILDAPWRGLPTRSLQAVPRLQTSTGCVQLADLVALRPSSFAGLTREAALTACDDALGGLVSAVRDKWSALDAQRGELSLSSPGESLGAHDRNGDLVIDDLGPSTLNGSWSTPGATGAAPKITVSVRTNTTAANVR